LLKIIFSGRVLTALIMFIIFLSMTLVALSYPPAARLMPLMIGIPGTILGFVQFIMEYRITSAELFTKSDESEHPRKAEERQNEIQMIVWMLLFFIGLLFFGFRYASPILVFSFLFFGKKESLIIGIISGLCTFLVIYGFFENFLRIPLFEGLIIEWFF